VTVLADRVARLRYDPRDPSAFFGERSDLAREVRLLQAPASSRAIRYEIADSRADERVRRLAALLAARERKLAKLRRLHAGTRPRPRSKRRGQADARQSRLSLGHARGVRP
jgi:hypothetical protein